MTPTKESGLADSFTTQYDADHLFPFSLTVTTWKTPVTPETPGAFPITTLWGQR